MRGSNLLQADVMLWQRESADACWACQQPLVCHHGQPAEWRSSTRSVLGGTTAVL